MDANGAAFLQDLISTAEPTEVMAAIADSSDAKAPREQNGKFLQSHGKFFSETGIGTHAEVGGKFFEDILEPALGQSVFRHPGADPIRVSGMGLAIREVGKEAHVEDPERATQLDGL